MMIFFRIIHRLVLVTFLLLIAIGIHAQEYSAKGGLTMSSMKNQGNFSVMPGIQFGVGAQLGGKEPLTFKIEALITQKGSNNWSRDNLRNVNLLYLEVPVMYNWEIISGYFIQLGFSPALLLLGNYRYVENNSSNSDFINRDSKLFDYSTFIGLDVEWKKNMFIGLRYNHSWVPIQGVTGQLYRNGELPLSRTFQLYIGYNIPPKQ